MSKSSLLIFVPVLACFCLLANSQSCNQRTCGDCIGTSGCVWCADLDIETSRCFSINTNTSCVSVQNPSGSLLKTNQTTSTNPISISNAKLKLRVGQPIDFDVNITALRNLPLDLYILMDLSSSMGPVLSSLQQISGQISSRIQNVTDNVRLAFGSFNDKEAIPFTHFVTASSPADRYDFLHQADFTSNTSAFSEIISGITITGNIDAAENGLEALAQVITCRSLLGWRDDLVVTRLVLYLSDEGFHYSGEGKFAGILNPYNEKCLLMRTEPGERIEFTRWLEVDYPSVGQIVNLVREEEVVVIFAVAELVIPTYDVLAKLINQKFRATIATLVVDSGTTGADNILDIVEQEYSLILQNVRLIASETDQVSIAITPICPSGAQLLPARDGCSSVSLDSSVQFRVTVTLNNCDNLRDGETRTVSLNSPTFGGLTVTYEGACNCDCENQTVVNSNRCNMNGNFSCGVCTCNEGYCGRFCNLTLAANTTADVCPRGSSFFKNEICSGPERGVCNCVCECTEETFGDACECDDFSCSAGTNETGCNGRGICCNGACLCRNSPLGNPYRGDPHITINNCQCEPEEEVCRFPENRDSLCNGRGDCECGGCACNSGWKGDFCQISLSESCRVEADAECITACRSNPSTTEPCTLCNTLRPVVFVTAANLSPNPTDDILTHASQVHGPGNVFEYVTECMYKRDGCANTYYILKNSSHITLVVELEEACPQSTLPIPIYGIAIIFLVVLVILAILIIVLIKVIFVILDYVEVQRWQKEAKDADFSKNQNPLYQSPEMKYENVAYGRE